MGTNKKDHSFLSYFTKNLNKTFFFCFNMFRSVSRCSKSKILKPNSLRIANVPVRRLNIHEYQSKQLMEKYGVNVQKNRVIEPSGSLSALDAAKQLELADGREYVVKAQVHAGGRGKGHFKETGFKGGVHVVNNIDDAVRIANEMSGKHLVTKQTTADGVKVSKVMIAEALDIKKEYYFAILMDRSMGGPVMVASPDGGVDIEAVAEKTPDRIFKEPVDIVNGLKDGQTLSLAEKLGFSGEQAKSAAEQMERLYKLFIDTDSTQVEINPLVETPDGRVVCFDAKIAFDDNASFRQKELYKLADPAEEDPKEVEAAKYDLNYVAMDGEIGCMVNGAGLAMSTMDIISHYGSSPANFLDVGGGATKENVAAAFRIITPDPKVKAILVNIFGGIMKCDTIAEGVVHAAKTLDLKIPLVVRLEGTNQDKGDEILKNSGLAIITAKGMDDAARKVTDVLKQ